jgi:hypothetical protein
MQRWVDFSRPFFDAVERGDMDEVRRLQKRETPDEIRLQAIEARRTFRAHGYYLLGESLPDFPA